MPLILTLVGDGHVGLLSLAMHKMLGTCVQDEIPPIGTKLQHVSVLPLLWVR
jgi:hypothetical protein